MSTINPIEQLNHELADKLLEEAEHDPQSAYRGKFIGIANGQVVFASDDWEEVSRQLPQAEPDAYKRHFIQIGCDGRQVYTLKSFPGPSKHKREPPILNAIQQLNRELGDKLQTAAQRNELP
jgi:hypothetical protein